MRKGLIIVASLASFALALMCSSCNKTPDGSYLNKVPSIVASDVENTHLNDLDPHISKKIIKGNLTVNIDADIIAPKAQKIYTRSSDYYDLSDKAFQKLAADTLLGDAWKMSDDNYGQLVYSNESGDLYIEPEKHSFIFMSTDMRSNESTESNFISDESLDHPYAVKAKEIADSLGFEQYQPYLCEKYGKLDKDNQYYLITLLRKTDNIFVKNTVLQSTDDENIPPVEKIEIQIADGKIWSVYIRAASISDADKIEVSVIPFSTALEVFENSGIGVLSEQIALNTKTDVTEISLSYIHVSDDNGYKLIPIWLFLIRNEWEFEGEKIIEYSYLSIDGASAQII